MADKTETTRLPLRVAMISEHGDPLAPIGGQESGGQNVFVYELARALSARGVRVDVYSRWDNRRAAHIVRFARHARVIRIKAGPRHFIAKDKLGPLMPEFVERMLCHIRENKIKYNVIHAHYYYSGWAAVRLRGLLGLPFVYTPHSLGVIKHVALGEKDSSPEERTRVEKEVMRQADLVLDTAPTEKRAIKQHYQIPLSHIAVLPPGVSIRRFKPLDQLRAKKKIGVKDIRHLIVFAGKMEERKGALTAIEATAEIVKARPDLAESLRTIVISGDRRIGRKREPKEMAVRHMLKDAVRDLKLEKYVQFLPGMPQEELHYYFAAADVTVMPSYYEPFGMVAIEAMASGSPVVASRVGGLQWTVEPGKTGFLAEPKNAKDFAEKIVQVLDDDKLAKHLRDGAAKRIARRFRWEVIAEKAEEIYHYVVKKT